ncbi:MAG: amidase [Betaproteobacteria bacterium]|nr:amidase [Betaproteobacteria bacterium]
MDIAFEPAHRLASLIRARKVGCLELLRHYLDRRSRIDAEVNAVCVLDEDRAIRRARAADRALARGTVWGPLHGVPMTVKESFDIEGLPTTWGRPDMRRNIATSNAVAVDRLTSAGAVIFGKTNVPVMLSDWQSFNPIYGTTNNPWDLDRIPGGSSGGAAAALASGITGLEIGSDIGASIRDPAHYCGVYGHKPTFGICSGAGHRLPPFLTGNDIAVIGPLARSAEDLEIVLQTILGPDPADGAAWQVTLPAAPSRPWRKWRVAVLKTAPSAPVDRAVQQRIQAVADFAASRGAKVSDKARPAFNLSEAHHVFIQLLRSATSRTLTDQAFTALAKRVPRLRKGAKDYESWMIAASTMTHREWLLLDEARTRMRLAWKAFFEEWDVLLCPPAATTAFPHNQQGERWERMVTVNGKPQPSTTQMFWAGYSGMAYLPSTVAPTGLARDGLPVGVQIVGPQYGDLTCIAFARMLEREFACFTPPPTYA